MFNVGDKVLHINDTSSGRDIGTIISKNDLLRTYLIDWDGALLSYPSHVLVLVMPGGHIDFQDKIKDRMG